MRKRIAKYAEGMRVKIGSELEAGTRVLDSRVRGNDKFLIDPSASVGMTTEIATHSTPVRVNSGAGWFA